MWTVSENAYTAMRTGNLCYMCGWSLVLVLCLYPYPGLSTLKLYIQYQTNGTIATNMANVTFVLDDMFVNVLGCTTGYWEERDMENKIKCHQCLCENFVPNDESDWVYGV